jgi:hypothetical protein
MCRIFDTKYVDKGHLEEREGRRRETLKWILNKCTVRMSDNWDQLRIVSNGGL